MSPTLRELLSAGPMPSAPGGASPAGADSSRRPCIHAMPGSREKKGCGKCVQRWLCTHPDVGGAPPGGWPEQHCLRFCKHREQGEQKPDAVLDQARLHRLRLAAILTAHNEGAEVARTVESIVSSMADPATELLVVVVDDGSTDESCSGLHGSYGSYPSHSVSVVRHDAPQGVGRSRNAGLAAALAWGADVVSFHDAHMRFPAGALEALARKALEGPLPGQAGAVVTSKARGWFTPHESAPITPTDENPPGGKHQGFRAWGADMHWNSSHGLQPKYRIYAKDRPEWMRVPCPMGACYVFSRATVEALSAPTGRLWDDVAGRWGFSEQALAVKAFLLDVPVLVSRDLATHHLYRSQNPVPNAGTETWKNVCFSMAALLSRETFDLRFRPWCDARLGPKEAARLYSEGRTSRADQRWMCYPSREATREALIWTHLLGRGAPITSPHPDHLWMGALPSSYPSDPRSCILQWRPGESTVALREALPHARITCLEWNDHRVLNWQAALKALRCELVHTNLAQWADPVAAGYLRDRPAQGYDLILIGGEMQDECRRAAERLLRPGGMILANPTADAFQVEDAERYKSRDSVKSYLSDRSHASNGSKVVDLPAVRAARKSPSVAVCLLSWRRPENIGPLLGCLAAQTARPQVLLWNNGEPIMCHDGAKSWPIGEDPRIAYYIQSPRNLGCMPRWWLMAHADADYVCSMDDDLLFRDARVLADAVEAQRELCPDGIVGFFGWERIAGRPYKAWRHVNGARIDQWVDGIKGRFMVLRRDLLERVPLLVPGASRREDDVYLSLCVSRGEPGCHLVPGVLGARWRELGKQDGRAAAAEPGHYEGRQKAVEALLAHFAPVPTAGAPAPEGGKEG